jgi:hypothetical protein
LRKGAEAGRDLGLGVKKNDTQQRPDATPAHNFSRRRALLATTSTAPTGASALSPEQPRTRDCRLRRNGAVRARCLAWLLLCAASDYVLRVLARTCLSLLGAI